MRTRAFGVLLAAAFLIAGCGSSGSGKPGATAATTTTTSGLSASAPDTPEQRSADRALARRALLRLGDLPAGYRVAKDDNEDDSSEDDTSAEDAAVNRRFADCAQLSPELTNAMLSDDPPPGIVDVQSPEFEQQSGLLETVTIDGSVDVGRNPQSVAQLLEIFDATNRPRCFEELFTAAIASEADGDGSADFESVEPAGPTGVGDRAGGFRVAMSITTSGITVPVHLVIVAAQRGRAIVALTATSIGEPVDQQVVASLLQKGVDRLEAAFD